MDSSSLQAVAVRVSAIAHATEDQNKVFKAILNFFPVDFRGKPETEKVRGHHGNEITICELAVKGRSKTEQFLENLWAGLSSLDKNTVYSQISSRLDETGNLYLRFDKQAALNGRCVLKEADPVKVRISFRPEGPSRVARSQLFRLKLESMNTSYQLKDTNQSVP